MWLLILPWLVALVVADLRHSATMVQENEILYDTVMVEHDGPVTRSKRSTNNMPNTMFFNLKSDMTNHKLRLRRAVGKLNIPTYVADDNQIKQVEIQDYDKSGVYIDHDTGRPIMVSERDGYYDLIGGITVNNNEVQLKPKGRGKHRLTKNGQLGFNSDLLTPKGGKRRRLSLKAMQRRLKRRNRRTKRQTVTYTAELLVVTDYAVKQKFLARNGGSNTLANAELKTYYAFVIISMDQRYKTVSNFYPNIIINVEGSGIVISDTETSSPYNRDNNNGNGLVEYSQGLDSFTDWVGNNRGSLPAHDHAMWFTDDQLASNGNTGVIGVAWLGTFCRSLSTSIVEDFYTGRTEQIAAHELGHSLGAYHDGDFVECSDSDYYVMAARSFFPTGALRQNPWTFSYCSAVYIAYYTQNSWTCMRVDDNGITSPSATGLSGQYLDADEQCDLRFSDTNSYFCRTEQRTLGLDLMCQRLQCYNPNSRTCNGIAAKDFTSCGNGRWCVSGACSGSASAPSTIENCPQGDNPDISCAAGSCSTYDARQLDDCCQTCGAAQQETGVPVSDIPTQPVSEIPSQPVSDIPTQPVSDIPSQPVSDIPTQPVSEIPSQPVSDIPTQPVSEIPSQPVSDIPTQPVSEIPSQPVSDIPTQPVSEIPSQPVSDIPTQPVSEIPSQPVSDIPTQPVSEIPSQPVSDIPTQPVSEIPSQPVSDIPTQPVSEIPPQPVSDIPTQPVSEIPSQPVSDIPTQPISEIPSQPVSDIPISSTPAFVCNFWCRWCRRSTWRMRYLRFCTQYQ